MTLTEFLLARIAEDEALLDAAAESEAEMLRHDGMPDTTGAEIREFLLTPEARSEWPRVLAECEAKRRIVEREVNSRTRITFRRMMVLQDLAAIYADHPDFRPEWAL